MDYNSPYALILNQYRTFISDRSNKVKDGNVGVFCRNEIHLLSAERCGGNEFEFGSNTEVLNGRYLFPRCVLDFSYRTGGYYKVVFTKRKLGRNNYFSNVVVDMEEMKPEEISVFRRIEKINGEAFESGKADIRISIEDASGSFKAERGFKYTVQHKFYSNIAKSIWEATLKSIVESIPKNARFPVIANGHVERIMDGNLSGANWNTWMLKWVKFSDGSCSKAVTEEEIAAMLKAGVSSNGEDMEIKHINEGGVVDVETVEVKKENAEPEKEEPSNDSYSYSIVETEKPEPVKEKETDDGEWNPINGHEENGYLISRKGIIKVAKGKARRGGFVPQYLKSDGYHAVLLKKGKDRRNYEYRVADLVYAVYGSLDGYSVKDKEMDEWKDIDGFEGDYVLSSQGLVRSFKNIVPIYLQEKGDERYSGHPKFVILSNGKESVTRYVDELVLSHFGKKWSFNPKRMVKSEVPSRRYETPKNDENRTQSGSDRFYGSIEKYEMKHRFNKENPYGIDITVGSDKQIRWAMSIAQSVMDSIKDGTIKDKDDVSKTISNKYNTRIASWWIDNFKLVLVDAMRKERNTEVDIVQHS